MDVFRKAVELKEEQREWKKRRSTLIDNFCMMENGNRKSQEFKNLKKEVTRFVKLKDKINFAEGRGDEDPVAKIFTKVNETIALLRDMGKKEMLENYLLLLSSCNVEVKDDKPIVANDISELEEKVEEVRANLDQNKADMNNLRDDADEQGICSKTRFNKLVGIYEHPEKEDAKDKLQEEYLLSGLISKGADAVSDVVQGKSSNGVDES